MKLILKTAIIRRIKTMLNIFIYGSDYGLTDGMQTINIVLF